MTHLLTNDDIFRQFLKFCKTADEKDVLKEYGGSAIYIPSYKGKTRDKDIVEQYNALILKGYSKTAAVRNLASRHNLSRARIYNIIKENE